MSAGWFRKLTVAGPATFKNAVTATTGALTAKSLILVGGDVTASTSTVTVKTVTASGTVSGQTVSASSRVTGTKGIGGGAQKLTHSTGQAVLNVYGLSVLSATANSTYTLGPPAAAGVLKHLSLSTQASATLTVKTTAAFVASTRTKITVVAGKAPIAGQASGRYGVTLVGATGGKWAIISYSPTSTSFTIT